MAGNALEVKIDPAVWYRLKQDLDRFSPALTRSLRKRIRKAGDVAAAEVKRTLRLPAPGSGADSGVGRAALAAGTRVAVSFGKGSAGVKIVTSGDLLPTANKGLLYVYNRTTFRHPVFGSQRWVSEQGRPYFEVPIMKVLDSSITDEMRGAIDDATKAIGGRV